MIQPWLDLYNKAIRRDRQTHWFSFINICSYPVQKTAYAKLPSDLWNVCSHHCGYVSKSESFWTNRLVQSAYSLIIVSILLRPDISIYGNTFTFRKRQEIGDVARRCEREPCTSEARKKQKVWLKKLKQLCTKKRHSSTKSFHEIPNSISPETLTVTHVGEKQTDYKKKKKAGGGQGACDLSARNNNFKSVKKKIHILQHPWDMQRNYIVSNDKKRKSRLLTIT